NRSDVAIAYPAAGQLCLRHAGTLRTFPADPPAWPVTPHRAPPTEQAFARILDAVQPDLIHIQHFLHWPLGVIDQAVAAGARVVVSFHDFYAITPLFTMQGTDDPEETFTPRYCQAVFGRDLSAYLRERRRLLTESLARVHARIAISPFLE